jgi:hypothetical protein
MMKFKLQLVREVEAGDLPDVFDIASIEREDCQLGNLGL